MSFMAPVIRCDIEFDRHGIRPSPRVETVSVGWAERCAAQQALEMARAAGRAGPITPDLVCHCPLCSPRC